jgi:hypothetical protein
VPGVAETPPTVKLVHAEVAGLSPNGRTSFAVSLQNAAVCSSPSNLGVERCGFVMSEHA